MPPQGPSPAGGVHPRQEPESDQAGPQEVKGLKEVTQGNNEEVIRLVQQVDHLIGQQSH